MYQTIAANQLSYAPVIWGPITPVFPHARATHMRVWYLADQVGLEPTTWRLTVARYLPTELLVNFNYPITLRRAGQYL